MRTSANENAAVSTATASTGAAAAHTRNTNDFSSTNKMVVIDLASWWCYAILKGEDLRLNYRFEDVLDFLGDAVKNSPIYIRLRCSGVWEDFLKLEKPGNASGGTKQRKTVLDRFILLGEECFPNSLAEDKFNEVSRMLQTHTKLSKLYDYFDSIGDDKSERRSMNTGRGAAGEEHKYEHDSSHDHILDQCNAELKAIYLGFDDGGMPMHMPASLVDLVNTTNGWDIVHRMDRIGQIIACSTKTSTSTSSMSSNLAYKNLKTKLQSLLLYWFEHEIIETGKLEKRYRGIGFGSKSESEKNNNDNDKLPDFTNDVRNGNADSAVGVPNENSHHLLQHENENAPFVTRSLTSRQQRQPTRTKTRGERSSPVPDDPNQQQQQYKPQRVLVLSNRKRKRNLREQENDFSLSNKGHDENFTNDDDDGSSDREESDQEERNRSKIYMHNERKWRLRNNFPIRQQQRKKCRSSGRQLEDEPSSFSDKYDLRQKAFPNGQKQRHYRRDRVSTTRRMTSSTIDDDPSTSDDSCDDDEEELWTQEQDDALQKGMTWNGYGNWKTISRAEKELLGSKGQDELRDRANLLLARR